jgi:uncharacterized protein YrzB (UPF0473 family)
MRQLAPWTEPKKIQRRKDTDVSSPEPEDEMQETFVVTMVDEEGEETDFALLDMIEVDGKLYGLFAPAEGLESEEEDDSEVTPVEADAADEGADDEDADEGILVLRAVQRGGEQDFELIEDQFEFDRVLKSLEQMATTQMHFGSGTHNN